MATTHHQAPRLIAPVIILAALVTLGVLSIYYWRLDVRGDPEHLIISGTIEGEEVAVGSKVGGRLKAIHVSEGDVLQSGQLVAEFDIPELLNQKEQLAAAKLEAQASSARLIAGARPQEIAQARAQVDFARAQLAELEQGTRGEDIAAAQAAWQSAEVDYDLARKDLERTQALYTAGVIARSQLDAAEARTAVKRQAADAAHEQYAKAQAGPRETQLDAAQAQVRAAQAVLDLLLAGSRPEDLAAAQARLAGVEAQLAGMDITVAEAQVLAPGDGVVQTLNYRPGDVLPAGAALINMLESGSLFVQVYIPEDKLAWVKPGTTAVLAVDAYPGASYSGKVTFLATQGEFTPRNLQTKQKRVEQVFRCKLQVADTRNELRPGMVCDVTFARPGAEPAL